MKLTWSLIALITQGILKQAYGLCSNNIWRADCRKFLDDSISISSGLDIGEVVYNLRVSCSRRKKRAVDDISMITNSTHFELAFSGNHDLKVKSCLVAGYVEVLGFAMHQRHGIDCGPSFLTVTVTTVPPVFLGNKTTAIEVDKCAASTIDVTHVELYETINCISWDCFIRGTNHNKPFWMNARIIQTSTGNINFSLIYEIQVTCLEAGSVAKINVGDYTATYLAIFTKSSTTCTSVTLSSTSTVACSMSANDCPTNTNANTGFFEEPFNTAAIAAATGMAVGAAAGTGIYASLGRCKAKAKPDTTRRDRREDRGENEDI